VGGGLGVFVCCVGVFVFQVKELSCSPIAREAKYLADEGESISGAPKGI